MEENIAVQEQEEMAAGEAVVEEAVEINHSDTQEDITDLRDLKRKTHFSGTVIGTTLAGAFVDIGLEVPGVVHISQLQAEPVNRVEDVVKTGDTVEVWVRRVVPSKQRVDLTMIEPLPLEWREIEKDMVIEGKVTRMERFGVFVDIGAERPGLVHISEITHGYIKSPDEVLKDGEEVEVKVLSVNRRRKQIKLSMKALDEIPEAKPKPAKQKPKQEAEEAVPEEEIPTAMEMAYREAMERSKEPSEETGSAPSTPKKENDYEDILSRTLDQRADS